MRRHFMNTKWKYKVDLNTEDAFAKVEGKLATSIPEELKVLIMESNGASPEQNKVKVNGTEKVLGAVLSYNENEQEADDVYTALLSIQNKKLIPFAIDPFGNYFCISGDSHTVVFWSHEENRIVDTEEKLADFMSGLY